MFNKLDRGQRGYLTTNDIMDFLSRLGVYCTEREANYLLRLYDLNKDGRIAGHEFAEVILPATNYTLRNLASNRATLATYLLPYKVESEVATVWARELEFYRDLEISR